MKEFPYIKPIFCEDTKIYMVDYDNKGYAGTDIFRGEVTLDKKIDEESIYEDFLEAIDNLSVSNVPIQIKKVHNIDLNDEKNLRKLRSLIKTSYDIIKKNSQFGAPSFIIVNSSVYSKLKSFIDKLGLDVIEDSREFIIMGKRNDNNLVKPGIYLYYKGDSYSVQPVGIRCSNQYLKLRLNIKK